MFSLLRRDDRGFTLVELMMVIVILGVLAGVAVPMLGTMKNNAMVAKMNTIIDAIGTAVIMEMATSPTDDFPADVNTIVSVQHADVKIQKTNDPAVAADNYQITVAHTPGDTKCTIAGYDKTTKITSTEKEFSWE